MLKRTLTPIAKLLESGVLTRVIPIGLSGALLIWAVLPIFSPRAPSTSHSRIPIPSPRADQAPRRAGTAVVESRDKPTAPASDSTIKAAPTTQPPTRVDPPESLDATVAAEESRPDPSPLPDSPTKSPAEYLASLGLERQGQTFHLKALEAQFAARMAELRPKLQRVATLAQTIQGMESLLGEVERAKAAAAAHDAQASLIQNELESLEKPMNSAAIDYMNQLKQQRKFQKNQADLVAIEVARLQANAPNATQLREAKKAYQEACASIVEALPSLREQCDQVEQRYEYLLDREPVHLALDELEVGGDPLQLETSGRHKRLARELATLERDAANFPRVEPRRSRPRGEEKSK